MSGIKTSKTFDVLTFYTDYKNRITPQNLIGLFQEIATLQSEKLKVGRKYMSNEYLIWVLIKYDIEIYRMPGFPEKIRLETYAMYPRKYYVYRKFEVYDENNVLIAKAYSAWSLINKKTESLEKMPEDLMKAYGCNKESSEKAVFEKIKTNKSSDIKKDFSIRYTDIDHNMHVNNTNYISWAINSIPANIVMKNDLKKISIFYRKEGKYKDNITVETSIQCGDEYVCFHDIKNQNDDLLCQVKTRWNNEVINRE